VRSSSHRRELKRRDDAITRTKHRAPTSLTHPPLLLSPTPPSATTAALSTTPRRCTPPSGESAPRPASFPACPSTLAPAHVPSFLHIPRLSLACAKTTPTPTAISIIHKNIFPPRTLAKRIVCLQTIAQSHCQHPSTSLSARTGCESRTFAASPVPRPSTPLPAVQPRVIRIHNGGRPRRRAVPDCCPH
jgi:hypothetical protein